MVSNQKQKVRLGKYFTFRRQNPALLVCLLILNLFLVKDSIIKDSNILGESSLFVLCGIYVNTLFLLGFEK